MITPNAYPDAQVAATVVTSMTGEQVISTSRMTTGDQYYVYAVNTPESEYVIRLTDVSQRKKFLSAIYWQNKFIPLGVPLAEFIKTDLDEKYSPFPALLMMRLQGDDLCNVYPTLTDSDKRNLANEIVKIHAIVTKLPEGTGYGISDSYEQVLEDKSWYEFIMNRLDLIKYHIKKCKVFDPLHVERVIAIAKNMEVDLRSISATPFLWDASERNVLVNEGKITGIVDVDDICFGDPLLVIGLTSISLELEGLDTKYAHYWSGLLNLDKQSYLRLKFYQLFYAVAFIRKHSMHTTNSKKIKFDTERLNRVFQRALKEISW